MRQFQLNVIPRITIKVLEHVPVVLIEQEYGAEYNKIRIPKKEETIRELIQVLEMISK